MVLSFNVSKNDDSMFVIDAKLVPGNATNNTLNEDTFIEVCDEDL